METEQYAESTAKRCGNCKYWDDFTGVCWNGDSDERADFTDCEFVCKWHKFKEMMDSGNKYSHRRGVN